jgi:hypothetical protein
MLVALVAMQLAAVDVGAAPSLSLATLELDWTTFLAQHDMTWRWGKDNASWPWSWQTGAWLGNGLHGIAVQLDQADAGSLRFEVARTDVWSCGYAPRLPVAHLRVGFAGTVLGGQMRQSLVQAVVTGSVTTTAGTVAFKVWAAATGNASVVEISATDGEAGAVVTLVPEKAEARLNALLQPALFANPPVVCTHGEGGAGVVNVTAATVATAPAAVVGVCTQHLACDAAGQSHYSTVLLRSKAQPGSYTVSVGNVQPTARMYPASPASRTNATEEALRNAGVVAADLGGFYTRHLAWWTAFYTGSNVNNRTTTIDSITADSTMGGSFLTVPDTRLEGFYHIQQAKQGSATRPTNTPLIDQTGPFRMDMVVKCSREPAGVNGTGWPFQMWVWCPPPPLHPYPTNQPTHQRLDVGRCSVFDRMVVCSTLEGGIKSHACLA